MKFYTYVWLRKKTLSPYYVGKGKEDRAYDNRSHNVKCPNDLSRITLQCWADEDTAFAYERYLIDFWGRKDNGTGILRNLTDGGEGCSGAIRSEETKKKISKSLQGNTRRLGAVPWNKGLVGAYAPPEETRARISMATRKALGTHMADCHPERKHKALGLCVSCYTGKKRKERKQNGRQHRH